MRRASVSALELVSHLKPCDGHGRESGWYLRGIEVPEPDILDADFSYFMVTKRFRVIGSGALREVRYGDQTRVATGNAGRKRIAFFELIGPPRTSEPAPEATGFYFRIGRDGLTTEGLPGVAASGLAMYLNGSVDMEMSARIAAKVDKINAEEADFPHSVEGWVEVSQAISSIRAAYDAAGVEQ